MVGWMAVFILMTLADSSPKIDFCVCAYHHGGGGGAAAVAAISNNLNLQ